MMLANYNFDMFYDLLFAHYWVIPLLNGDIVVWLATAPGATELVLLTYSVLGLIAV